MPLLSTYRAKLARRTGFYFAGSTGVQITPPASSYLGAPTGTDAARRIVSSDFASVDMTGTLPDLPGTKWENGWAYVPSRAEQRRIARNGFVANTSATDVLSTGGTTLVGYLTLSRPYGTTLPAATPFEVVTRWPVLDTESLSGLHTAINHALSVMRIPDRLAIVSTGVHRYDLSTYPWLKKPQQLVQVLSEESQANRDPVLWPARGEIRIDGHTPYLVLDAAPASGDTFYVDVYRPADTWIKVTGTWAESTVGLVNEADEAVPGVNDVVAVAYAYLAREMWERKPGDKDLLAQLQAAEQIAEPFLSQGQPQATRPSRQSYGKVGDSPQWRRSVGRSGGSRSWG